MPREPSDDAALLYDMVWHARIVVSFVQGKTEAEYVADLQLRFAVERAIEIIGEAARSISDELKAAHPAVPWRLIVLQRHILAHDYGEIESPKIWRVATVYIPELIALLEPLLPPAPPDPDPDPDPEP